jgi:hypothetical protein
MLAGGDSIDDTADCPWVRRERLFRLNTAIGGKASLRLPPANRKDTLNCIVIPRARRRASIENRAGFLEAIHDLISRVLERDSRGFENGRHNCKVRTAQLTDEVVDLGTQVVHDCGAHGVISVLVGEEAGTPTPLRPLG